MASAPARPRACAPALLVILWSSLPCARSAVPARCQRPRGAGGQRKVPVPAQTPISASAGERCGGGKDWAVVCRRAMRNRRRAMSGIGLSSVLALNRLGLAWADPRQGGDREGLTARGPNNVFAEGRTLLCDAECEEILMKSPLVETKTGLSYRDIRIGTGPKPPKGFQVTTNAVMMVADEKGELQPFVNSLARGFPIEFRIGTGSTIKGIDEGVSAMRLGGIRRLYIPAELSFPNGVRSDSRAPQVPPRTPIVVDVQLAYISGLDMEDEDVE